jgi:hypothetical protein
MDADRFDHLTRVLTDPRPRRAFAGLVLGGMLAATRPPETIAKKKKKCAFCKKRKRGKCKTNPAKNGVECGDNLVCANGRCVTFDDSCPAGANRCGGEEEPCGPSQVGCICFQRVGGSSLCADTSGECAETACTATTGCEPGAVCILATGSPCNCPSGTACTTPCLSF